MSWQEYVDNHLMVETPDGGQLAHAAIVGLEGVVWAHSPEFPMPLPGEIDAIVAELQNGDGRLGETGLFLGGVRYLVLRVDPGAVIHGKMAGGQDGVMIRKTLSALIIAIYGARQLQAANVLVEKLGDFLQGEGV